MRLRISAAILLSLFACGKEEQRAEPKILAGDDMSAPIEVIGVPPEDFECDTLAGMDDLREALGYEVEKANPSFETPHGVPEPCEYVGRTQERPTWSFDLDCRPRALEDGAALMVHYADAPEARPVTVGKSGLDHSGASLLFIDDDSPCYVRILGPDAAGRLALAQVIADRLTERTAPTGRTFRKAK